MVCLLGIAERLGSRTFEIPANRLSQSTGLFIGAVPRLLRRLQSHGEITLGNAAGKIVVTVRAEG